MVDRKVSPWVEPYFCNEPKIDQSRRENRSKLPILGKVPLPEYLSLDAA